jgi:hypothetical protein
MKVHQQHTDPMLATFTLMVMFALRFSFTFRVNMAPETEDKPGIQPYICEISKFS